MTTDGPGRGAYDPPLPIEEQPVIEDQPRHVDPTSRDGDHAEMSVRPKRLSEFIGQRNVVDNLRVYVEAAKARGEALDHVLFSGMPGLGKTTLAHLISEERGTNFRATSGPVLEKAKDLVGLLSDLEDGDVIFIDEVHRLNSVVEEYLYTAMEDYYLEWLIDQGPNARSVKINLKRFTLVAATTREGQLTAPFRARFGIQEKLEPYPEEDMRQILRRSATILGIELSDDGADVLACRCRGTPRIANRYLRRVRDFADVDGGGLVDAKVAEGALARLGVDSNGLDSLDRKILEIVLQYQGVPVGVKTISVTVGEDERTIEDVYEPYLIRRGFLAKTPRGRILGPRAEEVLGEAAKNVRKRATEGTGSLDFGTRESESRSDSASGSSATGDRHS